MHDHILHDMLVSLSQQLVASSFVFRVLSLNFQRVWSRPNEFPLSLKDSNGTSTPSLKFMVVRDWGGQDDPPYTIYTDLLLTWGQSSLSVWEITSTTVVHRPRVLHHVFTETHILYRWLPYTSVYSIIDIDKNAMFLHT